MAYLATVYKVMIASPSDVETERRIIRDVIHEWNSINSEDRGVALMPISWETHSSPSMDDRPQKVINDQVLADCDLLIATFWTRIGTPTGKSISGTTEEIEKHLSLDKPTMIYFSSIPVVLDSVEEDQYTALKDFRDDLKKRGLIETYESYSDFRMKLTRQLAQTVIREFTIEAGQNRTGDTVNIIKAIPEISQDAKELIFTAADEGNGLIIRLREIGGASVQAGNKNFVEKGDPRSEARWDKAIEDLEELGLIRDQGYKGEIYQVTADGYELVDAITLKR